MSVCFFNLLLNGEYVNLLILTAFSNKSFFGKTSSPVNNSHLPTFSGHKAEIFVCCQQFVCLNHIELFLIHFVIDCFYFLTNSILNKVRPKSPWIIWY